MGVQNANLKEGAGNPQIKHKEKKTRDSVPHHHHHQRMQDQIIKLWYFETELFTSLVPCVTSFAEVLKNSSGLFPSFLSFLLLSQLMVNMLRNSHLYS